MNRRERKKEETRQSIIDCAVSLFRENGFQETTMEAIADRADVSKGTLYNYFSDKESILVGYFQTIIALYALQIKETLTDNSDIKMRLSNILGLVNQVFKNDHALAVIYFKYRMQEPFAIRIVDSSKRSGIEKWVLEIIEKAQQAGELRDDIPALVLTRHFHLLALSFLSTKIFTEEQLEIDSIKTQVIELFLNGAKL